MSPRDLLLALVVVVAWGVNFVVIKVGLHGVPPMLLGALRFARLEQQVGLGITDELADFAGQLAVGNGDAADGLDHGNLLKPIAPDHQGSGIHLMRRPAGTLQRSLGNGSCQPSAISCRARLVE